MPFENFVVVNQQNWFYLISNLTIAKLKVQLLAVKIRDVRTLLLILTVGLLAVNYGTISQLS